MTETLTLTADELLRRFLQHVLPRGLPKVRPYGFLHPSSHVDRLRLVLRRVNRGALAHLPFCSFG